MVWVNNDGLPVKFAEDTSVSQNGGESTTDGNDRVVTIRFDYTDLAATGTEAIIAEGVTIPDGAHLVSADITVTEAFTSGGAATLTLGLIDTDRSTAYDADGIDATIALTPLNAVGKTVSCDGAVIGTTISNGGTALHVTATEGTAAFTAGAAQLVIKYFMP